VIHGIHLHRLLAAVACTSLFAFTTAFAVPASAPAPEEPAPQGRDKDDAWLPGDDAFASAKEDSHGAHIYRQTCAMCHETGVARAPANFILRNMPPAAIYRALTTGIMAPQGSQLSDDDKRAVAEYLSNRPIGGDAKLAPPACTGAAAKFDFSETPAFQGWGVSRDNARYIDRATAGLGTDNVGRLRLKWALGFEGATRARSQPAFAGGAIFVGSDDGHVYALDRNSGCARWTFSASSEVRTAITVSPWKAGDATAKPAVYFGDNAGNVYAVDAVTGQQVWRDRADPHPSTVITGSPILFKDRLYVPVSSLEEAAGAPTYECCTFRGSVLAYEAATGKRVWQTFMVGEPKLQMTLPSGTRQWGPSGVAIWNAPSIDAKRGVLYVATGDNYSVPATELSDAIVALDLKTGKIRWSYQALAGDYWNTSCSTKEKIHCPAGYGPDFDFGAATILAKTSDGREVVLAGQKSGWVYALSPKNGKLVWKTKVGRGGIMAGVYFGMAVKGDHLFVPISDPPDGETYEEPAKPGIYALDIRTGEFVWKAPNDRRSCEGRGPACDPGIAAPATVVDDLLLTGASDGWLRFYEAKSGKVLWQFDTLQDFVTVGGGTARGGSMGGGAGQVVYRGTLVVPSGYGFSGRMPGNLMLVFGVE
jgi:polyvinyl alcohol dehydrogenase (cytochrome)